MNENTATVDNRQPVKWLNYCGDQSHMVNDGPKGPTLDGELLYPVTADYDADNDVTRVGFSYIAPHTTV